MHRLQNRIDELCRSHRLGITRFEFRSLDEEIGEVRLALWQRCATNNPNSIHHELIIARSIVLLFAKRRFVQSVHIRTGFLKLLRHEERSGYIQPLSAETVLSRRPNRIHHPRRAARVPRWF
jgi:hypothetical protein